MAEEPAICAKAGQRWHNVFWEDFTEPGCLERSFQHPMGKAKWKWDAQSNKEIWWEPACAQIIKDDKCNGSKPFLRVCVFSDWFHRIDRLATKQKFGYGYYQARCRFQGAEGMHSAFWLLPDGMWDNPVPPGEIQGGVEVDVVEHRGKDSGSKDVSHQGNTAVHWGGYGANHRSVAYKQMNLPVACTTWATYGLLHEPGGMKWYWNGREVNSANVWSPMPNSMYFSTEVNESGGWAGQDLSSYGPIESPAGWIEIDHCGFWESHEYAEHPSLLSEVIPYRDPAMMSAHGGLWFTVRHSVGFAELENLRRDSDGEQSWFVPFPAGRVIRRPELAQTVISLESKHVASRITEWAGVKFAHDDYKLEVQEVCATGLRLRYTKTGNMSPHELSVNIMVHDAGLAEEERTRVLEVEQRARGMETRIDELAAELQQLKALLVQNPVTLNPVQ